MSTRTPIASITLSAAASSVTFVNIPQTYTDLVLVANITGVSAATDPWIRINSDTGTNYSWTWLAGNGSTAQSERSGGTDTKLYYSAISAIQNNVQNVIWNFNNYSNTTTYKTVLWRESDAGTETTATVGLWRSTSAITAIEISLDSSRTYSSGSTFNLYGIDAELSAQAKAYGGDTIVTDGSYWYHTFNTSGTFTPTAALTADYLVVAGGGAGGTGNKYLGGGGAGGYRTSIGGSPLSLTAQAYTVTVGAGGSPDSNGSNSIFSTITSTGGGYGGSLFAHVNRNGNSGGSGGGGASDNGTAGSGNAGSFSPVEGFAGGIGGGTSGNGAGGGGGGSSAVGTRGRNSSGDGTPVGPGAGGAGTANSISGSSVTYAGGGGGGAELDFTAGGAGGAGGGGKGQGNDGTVTAGTANTGGGGGGGTSTFGGVTSNGGSGIVIIRYAV